jgi:hypothetical protein
MLCAQYYFASYLFIYGIGPIAIPIITPSLSGSFIVYSVLNFSGTGKHATPADGERLYRKAAGVCGPAPLAYRVRLVCEFVPAACG